jgi:hypothetical protein
MALSGRSDLTLHKNACTLEVGADEGTLEEVSLTSDGLDKVFRKGAEKAVAEWFSGQWDRQVQEVDDLVQDLWAWYLETPETQRKMEPLSQPEAVETVRKRALQLLSKQTIEGNTFQGRDLFSSDAVKDALKGKSSNKYLFEVLPLAMKELQRQDDSALAAGRPRGYAEAIRSRYEDGVVPRNTPGDRDESAIQTLKHAIKALTAEINVEYITTEIKDIGSKTVVFADTRRPKGGHGDPTGDIAVLLVGNPSLEADYLEVTPISDIVAGRAATPAYDLGNGVMFRPSGPDLALLRRHPELLKPYLDMKRESLCTT